MATIHFQHMYEGSGDQESLPQKCDATLSTDKNDVTRKRKSTTWSTQDEGKVSLHGRKSMY